MKKTRGGARPGAGRKETGVNWVPIGFSVHKDDVDKIKAFVKEKKKELNEQRNSKNNPAPTYMGAAKKIAESPSFKKHAKEMSSYLAQRRRDKLKIE